jgi:hypothetical protein
MWTLVLKRLKEREQSAESAEQQKHLAEIIDLALARPLPNDFEHRSQKREMTSVSGVRTPRDKQVSASAFRRPPSAANGFQIPLAANRRSSAASSAKLHI